MKKTDINSGLFRMLSENSHYINWSEGRSNMLQSLKDRDIPYHCPSSPFYLQKWHIRIAYAAKNKTTKKGLLFCKDLVLPVVSCCSLACVMFYVFTVRLLSLRAVTLSARPLMLVILCINTQRIIRSNTQLINWHVVSPFCLTFLSSHTHRHTRTCHRNHTVKEAINKT